MIKIVATNESVEQREDLVKGMEIDNAQGDFDDITNEAITSRAEASAEAFVNAFGK